MTNGSATVTGTGTAFVANAQEGHAINLPDGRAYEVLAVGSNTVITLGSPYLGSTASGQSYSIQPNQGFAQSAASALATFLTQFGSYVTTALAGKFGDGTAGAPGVSFAAEQSTGWFRPAANTLAASINGTERVRLDANGNLLIATTTSPTIARVYVDSAESRYQSRNATSGANGYAGAMTTNQYRVGWAITATPLIFGNNDTERLRIQEGTGHLFPAADNAQANGGGSNRWSVVFAGTGTINTSDEREKAWRSAPTEAELDAAWECFEELGFYQWNDQVAEKGDAARFHFGPRAQRVWSIFAQHGLVDPIVNGQPGATPYAALCFDSWDDEFETMHEIGETVLETPVVQQTRVAGNRFGFRPDQLDRLMMAALKRESDRQAARIAALEAAAND
ncbi:MAG: hypothetical protein B7Y47_16615 [Sphingomonas sp. 28-63-12]|nr:MAG: hypothetical protein B7Y47_16615 [Sphingomonas sp. 28-63-12]